MYLVTMEYTIARGEHTWIDLMYSSSLQIMLDFKIVCDLKLTTEGMMISKVICIIHIFIIEMYLNIYSFDLQPELLLGPMHIDDQRGKLNIQYKGNSKL